MTRLGFVDKIPLEMRSLKRWVNWKLIERDGKSTKLPINPCTKGNAQSNNPDTWSDFKTAIKNCQDNYGVGFMFSDTDDILGVDLDKCIKKDTGEMEEWAAQIIKTFEDKAFIEKSPSGTGVHIICKGKLPKEGRRKGNIEMYEMGRFFTVTGEVLDGSSMTLDDCTKELKEIHLKHIAVRKEVQQPQKRPVAVDYMGINEIIQKAFTASNGSKFSALFNGDISGYPSHSEADAALCALLAFWTGCNPDLMDAIFRQSALYREKWDKKHGPATYGQLTIESAVTNCNQVYEPKNLAEKTVDSIQPKKRFTFDDTGNAYRLIHHHGKDLRYSFVNSNWFIWNGKYWAEDVTGEIKRRADDTIRKMYNEARDEPNEEVAKALTKWISQCRNASRKKNMITEAQHLEGIPVLPEEMDKDIWQLNCENGVIDLKTGKLLQHDRKYMLTKMIPVNYHLAAKADLWLKFLLQIMDGQQSMVDFLQRAIGYSLTGSMAEQCIFITYGSGANGKSTFLETIQAMLGDYSKSTNMQTFLIKQQGDAMSNDVARLAGARFVATVEADEGKRLSEALVKQVTGGDKMTARFLHKEFFEFTPQFKIWMGTNHKPVIKGGDHGIWRRIRLIPFTVTIPKEEQDGELKDKLMKELPGILNWAIEGCLRWQNEGLNPPEEVMQATESYQAEMDTLKGFLNDCCVRKEGAHIQSSNLYELYRRWCMTNGEKELSQTKFSTQLKERGLTSKKSSGMIYWEGITYSSHGRKLKEAG